MLNSRTVREMKTFFGLNGTQSEHFWANQEATSLWIEKLKNESESRDDAEPLKELIPWMMHRLAKERPTAQQVVNCILNFETKHAFYGMCCGNDDVTIQSSYDDFPPSYTEGNTDDLSEQLSYFPPSCKTITMDDSTRKPISLDQSEDSSASEATRTDLLPSHDNPEARSTIDGARALKKGLEARLPNNEDRSTLSEPFAARPEAHESGLSFLELKKRFVFSARWKSTKLI